MGRPRLLLLDEPTVGLDPRSRRHILDSVRRLADEGLAVLFTSHYMEEVEYLCRRLAILDRVALMALLELRRADGTLRGFAGLVVLPILAVAVAITEASVDGDGDSDDRR